jgi:hypothetical protein
MVEDHLRTQLRSLLDGLLKCPKQGDEDTVALGGMARSPVTNVDLAKALSKLLNHEDNVRTIYHEFPGVERIRYTTTEWNIGPWVCCATNKSTNNRVTVWAEGAPSAHTILTATAVRDQLKTMDVSDLLDHALES